MLSSSRSAPAALANKKQRRTNTGRRNVPKLALPLLRHVNNNNAGNKMQDHKAKKYAGSSSKRSANASKTSTKKHARRIKVDFNGSAGGGNTKLAKELTQDINEAIGLLDIDGDGAIDAEEFALARELAEMKIQVEDEDGDGKISHSEMAKAKALAGRRLMARKFFRDNEKCLHLIDQDFLYNSEQEVVEKLVKQKHFADYLNMLKFKEKQIRLSGSLQMNALLHVPYSGRPATGRIVDLSHSKGADVSYYRPNGVSTRAHRQKTSRVAEERKGALPADVPGSSNSTIKSNSRIHSLSKLGPRTSPSNMRASETKRFETATERRKEILFSARKNRCAEYGRTKGDIKGYGNFSNFAGTVIKQYGKMAY